MCSKCSAGLGPDFHHWQGTGSSSSHSEFLFQHRFILLPMQSRIKTGEVSLHPKKWQFFPFSPSLRSGSFCCSRPHFSPTHYHLCSRVTTAFNSHSFPLYGFPTRAKPQVFWPLLSKKSSPPQKDGIETRQAVGDSLILLGFALV